eukprot:jgi/Ulvmu1/9126/UM005_0222.1
MSQQDGDKAYAEAEKKLKGGFLGFSKDPDAAVDCFKRACNNYKVAGLYDLAAKAQMRVAEVAEKQGEHYDVAAACMEASKLYIKGDDHKSATACLQRAKKLYIQSGKVTQAARACKELANNIKDGDKAAQEMAMKTFLEAAKLYDSDSQYTDMYKMKLEAAMLQALMRQYKSAADLFESVATEYVNNNLLKYSAKEHFMNAALCWMAEGDITTAMKKREAFQIQDTQFCGSRQDSLLGNCLEAMLASKPDDFATAIAEWESMTKLESFRVKLLLAAKDTINVGGLDLLEANDDDDDFLT